MAAFDVTVAHQAKQLAKEAARLMDGLDLIVCNVGSGKSSAPGQETLRDWQESFAVNFWAAVNLIDAAKPYLVKSGGTIICISSICGNEVIPGAPVTYSTAKAALNAYIKNMSRPLAAVGVRIMGIAPGNIIFDGSSWDEKRTSNPDAVAKMLKCMCQCNDLGVWMKSVPSSPFLPLRNVNLQQEPFGRQMEDKLLADNVFSQDQGIFDLSGKLVVITGGAGLLGSTYADAILAHNGKAVLLDISQTSLDRCVEQLSSKFDRQSIFGYQSDITNEASVQKTILEIIQNHGPVHGLVNNAANNPKVEAGESNFSRFETFSIDQWKADLDVGLTGAFLCTKHIGQTITHNKNGGVIINISSDLGLIYLTKDYIAALVSQKKNNPKASQLLSVKNGHNWIDPLHCNLLG